MEQSAVSHQLRLLRAMGLVTGTRQGPQRRVQPVRQSCGDASRRSGLSHRTSSGSESPTTRSLPCKELTPICGQSTPESLGGASRRRQVISACGDTLAEAHAAVVLPTSIYSLGRDECVDQSAIS